MTPFVYPLTIYRGDTGSWRFTLCADNALILAPLACVIALPNVVDVSLTAELSGTLTDSGSWDLQLTFPYMRTEWGM